ncbi:hypothetical protein HID58_038036, partial [Brassica napus]
ELMSKEMAKINRDMLMLREDQAPKVEASLSQSEPRKISMLLKSCEIFRVRQEKGLVKPYVILHSGAVSNWEMFDKDFKTFQRLPKVPSSDYCFFHSDKETTVVHSCRPSPDVEEQHWEEIKHWCVGAELPQFIHNCCVIAY